MKWVHPLGEVRTMAARKASKPTSAVDGIRNAMETMRKLNAAAERARSAATTTIATDHTGHGPSPYIHEHELTHCSDCNVVYCKGCSMQWGGLVTDVVDHSIPRPISGGHAMMPNLGTYYPYIANPLSTTDLTGTVSIPYVSTGGYTSIPLR